jgi:hypothetical protein
LQRTAPTSISVEGIPALSGTGRLSAVLLMGFAGVAVLLRGLRC